MKKILNINTVLFLIVLLLPVLAMAQTEGLPETDNAPIDVGLSLLVAAGVGYGAKKLKERKNNKLIKD